MRRWAVELTGRNSVRPSMIPRTTESRYSFICYSEQRKIPALKNIVTLELAGFSSVAWDDSLDTGRPQSFYLVRHIAPGGNVLLHEKQQSLRPARPLALTVLRYDALGEEPGFVFGGITFGRLLLGSVNLD